MKEKILKLIDSLIQDNKSITKNYKNTSRHYTRIIHDVYDDDKYIYPNLEPKSFTHYSIEFSIDGIPKIEILIRSKEIVVEEKIECIKNNSWFGIPTDKKVELNLKVERLEKITHYIKYGEFVKFDLTDLEVESIYDKINKRRLELKKKFELDELNKQFENFGIV
jgi:hypothetical protein